MASDTNPLIQLALRDGIAERNEDGSLHISDKYWEAVFIEMMGTPINQIPHTSNLDIVKRAVSRLRKEKSNG